MLRTSPIPTSVSLLATLVALAPCLALCLALAAPATAGSAALSLVVSIHPLEMILVELAGDRVHVWTLVPSGASPHTFEPNPSDLVRVARADGFVRIGGGYDDWTERILASAGKRAKTVSVSDWMHEDATSHEQDSGHAQIQGANPHTWLDPVLVRDRIVPELVAMLGALDPPHRDGYRMRGEAFRAQLTQLDEALRVTLAAAPGRRFIAFHDAWPHFAARYALVPVGVVQRFAGEEPTPREVAALVKAARDAGVPAILVEPQLDPRLARTIAREFGGDTVLVDPLGDRSDPERASYAALMRFNATAFTRALGGSARAPGVAGDEGRDGEGDP